MTNRLRFRIRRILVNPSARRVLVALALAMGLAMASTSRTVAASPPASYNIRLSGVNVLNTRARGKDTVYAQFSLLKNGALIKTVQWDGTCSDQSCQPNRDFSEGLHVFGLAVSADTGRVTDTDRITWRFQIINAGHAPSDQNYTQAANALSDASCRSDPNDHNDNSGWLCAAGRLAQTLVPWFTANCDGPIAADEITKTGAELFAMTQGHQDRGLPSGVWSKVYKGVDSPAGCGSNSVYSADVWVDRR